MKIQTKHQTQNRLVVVEVKSLDSDKTGESTDDDS